LSSQQAQELLDRGIEAAKAGRKDDARKLLQGSLRLNQQSDTAWLWLASVANDKRERLLCLQKVLEINPNNEMGIKAIKALGIEPEQLLTPPAKTAAPPSEIPPAPSAPRPAPAAPKPAPTPQPSTREALVEPIAMPRQSRTEAPEDLAQQIVDDYLAPLDSGNVVWTRKTRRRAGESEIVIWRLQVAAVITAILLVIGGVAIYGFLNSPQIQLIVLGASETPRPPTRTATNTPTNTPGFTPTPSPTRDTTALPTFTVTPTIDSFIRAGPRDLRQATLTPTRIYPAPPGNLISTAAVAVANGDYAPVIPLMGTAQAQLGNEFEPNPFYYQAIAYARDGQAEAGLNVLTEAQSRLANLQGVRQEDVPRFSALIAAGFGEVYLQQARDSLEGNNIQVAGDQIQVAQNTVQTAIEGDPLLVRNYLLLAESFRLQGDYVGAIEALDSGLALTELSTDLNLIVAKAETYLEEGRSFQRQNNVDQARTSYGAAAWQAYRALYINPRTARAHSIQVETALALDDPGLAVIQSQAYLFFFPDSAEAYKLLGDARTREGNLELALDAYTRAIDGQQSASVTEAALIARAQLYSQQNRPRFAVRDLTAAIDLDDKPTTRALRMQAAYEAKNYAIAGADAESLLGSGVLTDDETELMQARVLIDRADESDTDAYTQALTLLANVGDELPAALIPTANEYRARVLYGLGQYDDALNAVNLALSVETGGRHYLRGLIFEALSDFDGAIAEFNWVLTWSQVYPYPFTEDARTGIDRVQATIAELNRQATATSRSATQSAIGATATRSAQGTATVQAATESAGATATFRALPTPTPTPSGS